jgi:hypothetical protein
MKGAIAVEPPKTIIAPTNIRMITAGKSQNFFLTLKNPQISLRKSIYCYYTNKFN